VSTSTCSTLTRTGRTGLVEAYGEDKYAKLGRIKAQYDPGNLFRVNYNITPR